MQTLRVFKIITNTHLNKVLQASNAIITTSAEMFVGEYKDGSTTDQIFILRQMLDKV